MNAKRKTETTVVVVGGGINGAGVARDLALRGIDTVLVEKGDIARGTSWASSGMIHGGLRYLLSDVHTTYKSSKDAGYIKNAAPHLIFRIPLMMPTFAHEGLRGRVMLSGADALFAHYDRFQPLKGGWPHKRLSAQEARAIEPRLAEGVVGAVLTDEWGIDVPRLCIANALDAHEHGAEIRSWTALTGFIREGARIVGVSLRDELDGERYELRCKLVVNCAGPWAPKVAALAKAEVKLRPAKGVHLVLDRRVGNTGLICNAIDGRQVFIIPHENTSVIGTTDDDYYGDPDRLDVGEDEIEYLLWAVESVWPEVRRARIVKSIAGLRPTLFERAKYEDDLTRDHRVIDHAKEDRVPGLLTLAGGKLAAYRIMAQDATDTACALLNVTAPCRTQLTPLPGGAAMPDAFALAQEFDLDAYVVKRLIDRQGDRADRVLELIRDDPSLGRSLCECEPVLVAEAVYAMRHEFVRRPSDLLTRCRLAEGPCQDMGCILRAVELFACERGLSSNDAAREIDVWLNDKWRWRRPILSGAQLANEELLRLTHQALKPALPRLGGVS